MNFNTIVKFVFVMSFSLIFTTVSLGQISLSGDSPNYLEWLSTSSDLERVDETMDIQERFNAFIERLPQFYEQIQSAGETNDAMVDAETAINEEPSLWFDSIINMLDRIRNQEAHSSDQIGPPLPLPQANLDYSLLVE